MKRGIRYNPLPTQARFHKLETRFKGFSGPVGSGKSQALCQEAIRLAYVNAGCMGLIGAPTYPMLRDSTQISMVQVLEENAIPFDVNKAENTLTFTDTGSKILFRSMDDYERLRGTNLAWFGVDELTYTHEEAWIRLEARLRDPGYGRRRVSTGCTGDSFARARTDMRACGRWRARTGTCWGKCRTSTTG